MQKPIKRISTFRYVGFHLIASLVLFACKKQDVAEPTPAGNSDIVNVSPTATVNTSTTSIKIEAESYAKMSGIVLDNCSEGGQNAGGIQAGDWMDYSVNVPSAGTYTVNFRVAGPGGQFQLKNAAGTVLASVTAPKTSGYQSWTTVSTTATLAAGQQTLRIYAVSGGYNINWFELVGSSTAPAPTPAPTPVSIKIEAESYAKMSGIVLDNCSEGGQNAGGIQAGDWMDYSVNVPSAGTYTVNFRVAGPGGQFQLKNAAGTVLASVTAPKTSGYQSWTTVSTTATLAAGQQTLRIYAVSGGYNINWFELVGSSTAPAPTPAPTPTPDPTPAPAPAPAPTPGPISSNIIYRENFEGSSFWPNLGNEWNTTYGFTTVSNNVAEGQKAGRFELKQADAATFYRSEVRWPESYSSTSDRWVSFYAYWPSGTEQPDSKDELFHQCHQTSQTSPPLSMHIKNGHIYSELNGQVLSGVLGQGSGTIDTDLGQVPTDQWVKFVIHYKFSYNNDGIWQIWKNGAQVLNYSGKTIYPPSITTSLPSFKLGIYKWVWSGGATSDVNDRVMYVDDVRIGNEKCTYNDL